MKKLLVILTFFSLLTLTSCISKEDTKKDEPKNPTKIETETWKVEKTETWVSETNTWEVETKTWAIETETWKVETETSSWKTVSWATNEDNSSEEELENLENDISEDIDNIINDLDEASK